MDAASQARRASRRLVLVVDSDEASRKTTSALLARADREIVSAGSAQELREALTGARPDAIVIDPALDGTDGFLLCRSIIDGYGDASPAVILASAKISGKAAHARAREVGAFLFVERPGQDRTLADAVDHAIVLAERAGAAAHAAQHAPSAEPERPAVGGVPVGESELGAPGIDLADASPDEFEHWLDDAFSTFSSGGARDVPASTAGASAEAAPSSGAAAGLETVALESGAGGRGGAAAPTAPATDAPETDGVHRSYPSGADDRTQVLPARVDGASEKGRADPEDIDALASYAQTVADDVLGAQRGEATSSPASDPEPDVVVAARPGEDAATALPDEPRAAEADAPRAAVDETAPEPAASATEVEPPAAAAVPGDDADQRGDHAGDPVRQEDERVPDAPGHDVIGDALADAFANLGDPGRGTGEDEEEATGTGSLDPARSADVLVAPPAPPSAPEPDLSIFDEIAEEEHELTDAAAGHAVAASAAPPPPPAPAPASSAASGRLVPAAGGAHARGGALGLVLGGLAAAALVVAVVVLARFLPWNQAPLESPSPSARVSRTLDRRPTPSTPGRDVARRNDRPAPAGTPDRADPGSGAIDDSRTATRPAMPAAVPTASSRDARAAARPTPAPREAAPGGGTDVRERRADDAPATGTGSAVATAGLQPDDGPRGVPAEPEAAPDPAAGETTSPPVVPAGSGDASAKAAVPPPGEAAAATGESTGVTVADAGDAAPEPLAPPADTGESAGGSGDDDVDVTMSMPTAHVISPPEVIQSSRVQPRYPIAARRARVEGSVLLRVLVGEDGSVREIDVTEEPTPNLGFGVAARNAVSSWRYRPATSNGRPVEAWTTVRIRFAP